MNADSLSLIRRFPFGNAPILVSIVSHDSRAALEARPLVIKDECWRESIRRDARLAASG